MLERYWTEAPEWKGRMFTITDNGIVKVRKFLSYRDIAKQDIPSGQLLNLMAAIEEQAEAELNGNG